MAEINANVWDRGANAWRRLVDTATVAWNTSVKGQVTADARNILPPGFVSVRYAQAADTDHDVTLSAGRCRDDTDTYDIVLGSALTKQIDAAWAVGNNQGGLDTSSVGNNLFYYLWIIQRSDTGVVDALFSLSATAPTMPAGYDRKQRVGVVRTDGSANILAFVQAINNPDEVRLTTPILDVSVANLGTSRTAYALSVPPTAEALFRATWADSAASNDTATWLGPLTETDTAPTTANGLADFTELGTPAYYVWLKRGAGRFRIETDGSSQIAARSSVANTTLRIGTYGWRMQRGIIP